MASSNGSGPELSREEAIKVLEMFLHKQCSLGRTEFAYDADTVWEAVKMAADSLKTDEAYQLEYEKTSGEWLGIDYAGYADGQPVIDLWECSRCGYEHTGDYTTLTDYCPHCGAKMESEDQDD